jgi:AcrR family transcriptional regulator
MVPRPRRIPGVRPPQQDRSRDTYARILDATERLLESREFDALRVEQVLAEAGVSTGSFYARFSGKQALLDALLGRYMDGLRELTEQGARATGVARTLEARARAEVRHRISRFRGRKALLRTCVLRYRKQHDSSAEVVRLTRIVNQRIVDFFRPCFDEIGHEHKQQAVLRGAYFVAAVCRDRILFSDSPHVTSVDLPLAALEEELTGLLLCYLKGPMP